MLEIISGISVKKVDEGFVLDKGISSHKLMENAALAFCNWFERHYQRNDKVGIFCGHGNNGGDGLAIARMLWRKGYDVIVFLVGENNEPSPDCKLNRELLPDKLPALSMSHEDIAHMEYDLNIVVDALLGVGINRPLEGDYKNLVNKLNSLSGLTKISIDIPTGLPSDDCLAGDAFIADITLSFQSPKFSLLFPEHANYVGQLKVVDIGINQFYLSQFSEGKFYVQKKDIALRHKNFSRFSHKGDFGKVMLVGGSFGSMGAIRMSSEAALRTGSGLACCMVPGCGVDIMQVSLPEAQVWAKKDSDCIDADYLGYNFDRFDAVGVGPGMGTHETTAEFLRGFLTKYKGPIVVDADGLNILAKHPEQLSLLADRSILTPHLLEFERLAGHCKNHKDRLQKASDFSKKHKVIIVLKGAHTCITFPDGRQFFNSTGNKHMATGGSGDILTGMITSFLGQGYSFENAALCAVFHHGLSGEIASADKKRGTIATDIIKSIPLSYLRLGIE